MVGDGGLLSLNTSHDCGQRSAKNCHALPTLDTRRALPLAEPILHGILAIEKQFPLDRDAFPSVKLP